MSEINEEILKQINIASDIWLLNHDINIHNILIICLIAIEQLLDSDSNKFEKIQGVNEIFPTVLIYLENTGKITPKHIKHFMWKYNDNKDLYHDFINIILDISNQPNLICKNKPISINLLGRIKNYCFPCLNTNTN